MRFYGSRMFWLMVKRDERELKIDRLRQAKALGEKYYDQMYESRHGVTGIYSDTKDVFGHAISLANENWG
ncbi:MAG TPA: hypothetical protein VFF39_04225 [Verrucomicrobiae bacterium]|nr:hypothetical protein [Verrucomicrobiae bacterium]